MSKREGEQSKKQRKAIEFMCPISLDLPVEPVMASDGRVYNRADIQRHIDTAKKQRKEILSPITKEKLKEELLPAVQVTNTIRSLVESGVVEGGLADQWKMIDTTKAKAEKGDSVAMCNLASCYCCGNNGFMKDYEKSYYWYEKGADLGNLEGMAWQGMLLLTGSGVEKDSIRGTMMVTMAAERGFATGAFILGDRYFRGTDGFCKNTKLAKFWLEKARALDQSGGENGHKQMHKDDAKKLTQWLSEI